MVAFLVVVFLVVVLGFEVVVVLGFEVVVAPPIFEKVSFDDPGCQVWNKGHLPYLAGEMVGVAEQDHEAGGF